MLAVKRIGHLTLATPDVERQVDYYTRILGLTLVAREDGRAILATHTGLEAVVLERGSRPDAVRLAMQVAPGSDLREISARLSKAGIASKRHTDITPGVREAIVFKDPHGRDIEILSDYAFAPLSNDSSDIRPRKLGHVAFHTPDLAMTMKFYCDILGFKLSDQRSNFFAFLRCSRDHHSLNFLQIGNHAGLHHVAFELRDQTEIGRACDVLAARDVRLYWGPLRHIIGHNIAVYHKNPDDVSIELFTDLDIIHDEDLGYFEPRPWHQDRPQRPKIWGDDTPTNYWGPEFGPAHVGPKTV
jgi:catechol 2,3-dioxygenase-like lactoylglutathione lyase family enzyme